ncbi:hypothetical protein ABFS82_14G059500 [Erythranthe guttata]|uniref:Uncharacterized protein n=1 Tax=Erythranthe guttata TaxID=4155 RepID=A0A022RP14_ERYGU|nr:PREDICTED: uncharacterized protein LOC105954463 [Erythranthe guttata]EYU40675.1 hypothetical protein MIMGU_mgv1a014118mg [Erythranthe guttata]|eukprot:XP_012833588.1 PREDICTED: uncharacterized protein LOC105954463 [Erythranthe guttata]
MSNGSLTHRSNRADDESPQVNTATTTTTTGKPSKTSIHVTALDGIVNVNSLFTVAIFIGFSLTEPSASGTGHRPSCNAAYGLVRRLIVYEVVSFSSFLFSSLIAQSLKLVINLLNNLDPGDAHKADIDPRVLKTGLLGSALGSFVGCVFLMLSFSNFVQVKLGVFSCGGESLWSVVILGVFVGFALLVYLFASLYALCFI